MKISLRGLCEGAVAKIFRVEEKTAGEKKWKVLNLAISESVPNPEKQGEYMYKNVFNGFVNYGGPIKAETLTGALVVLRGVSTTSTYDKEKNKNYVNHSVSDLAILKKGDGTAPVASATNTAPAQATPAPATTPTEAAPTPEVDDVPIVDVGDDEFPF